MTRSLRRLTLLVALSAVSLLAIGAAAAAAHGGGGLLGPRGASAGALVTKAAANLGVSKAALTDAIEKAAATRIDEAVADGDLDEEDAADLKDAAGENLRLAMAVSRTRTVAANLSKTTAQLNTAFREARKALLLERIDEAVEDGDLDEDEAAELKEEVDEADLPGYKAGVFHHGPGARGLGAGIGPRGGFGHFAHRA